MVVFTHVFIFKYFGFIMLIYFLTLKCSFYFIFNLPFYFILHSKLKPNSLYFFFFFDYFLRYYFVLKIFNFDIFLCAKFRKNFLYINYFWFRFIKLSNIYINCSFLNVRGFFFSFINFFFTALLTCDSKLFLDFIVASMCNISIKNHKLFLMVVKYVMFFIFKYLFFYINLVGVYFMVIGKISASSSSKTRTVSVHIGNTSYSRRLYLLSYHKCGIFLFSGVVGFTFIVFF